MPPPPGLRGHLLQPSGFPRVGTLQAQGARGRGWNKGLGGCPTELGGDGHTACTYHSSAPPPSPIPQGRLNLAVTYSLGWREQAQAFPPPPHYSTQPPFRFYPKPF